MTDDTGMLQHAIFSVPNTREGYTTDDNARALVVSMQLDESVRVRREMASIQTCRAGIWRFCGWHSIPTAGDSEIFSATIANGLEEVGSEDSHGRALWALGHGVGPLAGCGIARRSRKAI